MDFKLYLEQLCAQKKIDKLAKIYKNRKIAIYGAGEFSNLIFENYDLSKLNIVAVADLKFKNSENNFFHGYKCIFPEGLRGGLDYNLILIANFDAKRFVNILDKKILYGTKNARVEIRPLIKPTFGDVVRREKNG